MFPKKLTYWLILKNQKHKNFVSKKNNHVLGGLIFIIFWIITLFFESSVFVNDMEIYYVCIFVFIIGLFSDFKILENPSKGLFFKQLCWSVLFSISILVYLYLKYILSIFF